MKKCAFNFSDTDHSDGRSDEDEDEEERLVFEETNFNFNEFLYRYDRLPELVVITSLVQITTSL